MLGAVEVGKNERYSVIAQAGAVAAARLAGGGEQVHQLVVQHFVEELRRFGRKLIVEFLALRHNGIGIAAGGGVAAAEHQRVVGKVHRVLLAQTLGLLAVDAVCQRHKVLDHGGAEFFNVRLGVAVAPHTVVAQGGVALVAELFAHGVAQVDELVVDAVKLRLMLLIPLALRLPCRQTARIVGVVLEGGQLAQRVDAALKGNLGAGDQLAVLGGQFVFLCHFGQNFGRERLVGDFGVDEHQIAVLGGKVLAEGAGKHRLAPCVFALLQLGQRLVPEVHLLVIELVAGVDGVAHAGKVCQGVDVLAQSLLLQKNFAGGGVVRGSLQLCQQVGKLLLDGGKVGALIGHFGKFHGVLSFYKWVLTLSKIIAHRGRKSRGAFPAVRLCCVYGAISRAACRCKRGCRRQRKGSDR